MSNEQMRAEFEKTYAKRFLDKETMHYLVRNTDATGFPVPRVGGITNDSNTNFAAPAAPTDAKPDAIPELRNAFMTLESNGGEGRTIVLKFNQRSDAYAVHDFLLKGGSKDCAGSSKSNSTLSALCGECGMPDLLHTSPCMAAINLKSSPQAPKQEGGGV